MISRMLMVWLLFLAAVGSACSQMTEAAHLMVQRGSRSTVHSVAVSPDNRYVVTSGMGNAVQLWDSATGVELHEFKGRESVEAVAFSPDGKYLVIGSQSGPPQLWDVSSGLVVRSFEGSTWDTKAAFSADGRWLVTGTWLGSAHVWQVSTGKRLMDFGSVATAGPVGGVAISPDGGFAAFASVNGDVVLVNTKTGKQETFPLGSTEPEPRPIAFSGDGKSLLIALDTYIGFFDLAADNESPRRFALPPETRVLALSGDGRYAATSNWNVLDLMHNAPPRPLIDQQGGVIWAIQFSSDDQYLAEGYDNGIALLLRVSDGKLVHRLTGMASSVATMAVAGDGRSLATVTRDMDAGYPSTVHVWDVKSGGEIGHLQIQRLNGIALSGHGTLLLTGENAVVRMWNSATLALMKTFEAKPEVQRVVAPAAISKHSEFDDLVMVDESGKEIPTKKREEPRPPRGGLVELTVLSILFSPDDRQFLATYSDETARLWDVESGTQMMSYKDAGEGAAFAPNGRSILLGMAKGVARLVDAGTGEEQRRFHWATPPQKPVLPGYNPFFSTERGADSVVSFSPDGTQVLTAEMFGPVVLWDFKTGERLAVLSDSAMVQSAAFSPDGRYVLSNDVMSNAAVIWSTSTGKEVRRLVGHQGWVRAAGFVGTGMVATASDDATVREWDLATGNELCQLISFINGGWAVIDPAGRYDASDPDRSDGLYWVTSGLKTVELKQLKKQYYTPRLLLRVDDAEHLPTVAGMEMVAMPPLLRLAHDFDSVSGKMTLEVTNDGGGVGKVLIRVDGRLLHMLEKPRTAVAGKSFMLSVDLNDAPFVAGENVIQVTAYDASNRTESKNLVVRHTVAATIANTAMAKGMTVITTGETASSTGKFYAIVVGTSTFGGPGVKNLTFPSKDAESIATGLQLGAVRLYQGKENVWIRVLTSSAKDENLLPTKKNIKAAFDEVHRLARPEDTLLVYLSGHGAMSSRDRDTYYYLTQDATDFDIDAQTDPKLKDRATVSSGELFEWLREPVKTMPLKQVVILDTCAAGALVQDTKLSEKRDIPPDQRRAMELLKDGTGTFILMGSAADQASYEANRYGEGLLTYALLDGMRGAAIKDATRLDVSDWFDRASSRVPELAKSIGGIQRPVIAAPKGRNFPVVMLSVEDREKIPLAISMPQLLRVLCIDDDLSDRLKLRDPLREELRAVNDASARGSGQGGISYLDSTDDDMPGAISPRVQYKVTGASTSVHVLLKSGSITVADETITVTTGETPALAKVVSRKIVEMASRKSQ